MLGCRALDEAEIKTRWYKVWVEDIIRKHQFHLHLPVREQGRITAAINSGFLSPSYLMNSDSLEASERWAFSQSSMEHKNVIKQFLPISR